MLLAFSARPEELEVLLISLTFGNVGVQKYGWLFFFFPFFLILRSPFVSGLSYSLFCGFTALKAALQVLVTI